MKQWKILILISAVVVVSGCTFPSFGTGGGGGLTMQSSLSDATMDPGTQVQLTLTVQNTGSSRASGISVQLNGLSPDWGVSPGRTIGIHDLGGTDISHNINQGETDVEYFTLTAPGRSNAVTYPFSTILAYNYQTTSNIIIRAASFDYWKTNKIQTGVISTTTSGGPVQITVTAPNSVFKDNSIPVYFTFNNVGSGVVQDNSLSVSVSGPGINCQSGNVRLIPDSSGVGRTGFLRCTASTSDIAGAGWGQLVYDVSASYRYSIEQFSSISVNAKIS